MAARRRRPLTASQRASLAVRHFSTNVAGSRKLRAQLVQRLLTRIGRMSPQRALRLLREVGVMTFVNVGYAMHGSKSDCWGDACEVCPFITTPTNRSSPRCCEQPHGLDVYQVIYTRGDNLNRTRRKKAGRRRKA